MLPWKNLFGMYGRGHFCNKLKRSILLLFLLGMFPYAWGQQTNVSLNLRNVPIKVFCLKLRSRPIIMFFSIRII